MRLNFESNLVRSSNRHLNEFGKGLRVEALFYFTKNSKPKAEP